MSSHLQMPTTKTPAEVWIGLAFLVLATGGLLYWPLGFWGVILTFVVLAATTRSYTETVPGFIARIILNHLTGRQRTIFQGMNFKLPWETPTHDVDLRVDLKEVLKETYASKDALMETRYIYTIRPDFSGDNAGEKVILYASYEPDAIKMEARALFSMSLSDYYGRNFGKDLLDKLKVNREVFETGPGLSSINKFEEEHGTDIVVRLEDSDFSESAQAARDTISRAKSLKEAVEELMKPGSDGIAMSREQAEKIVRMMNIPGVQEHIISVDAKGLENLEQFTVLGGLGKGGKK